jgi:carbamoyl-phosphate synthase large subunit
METRVLILRAGTGASNNLIRSLRAGDPSLFIVGCHADRFVLKKSPADKNYLTPPFTHPAFPDALCYIIAVEQINLLMPNSDPDVKTVSDLREQIPCRLFLPSKAVIELCQDKLALATFLRSHGVPAPATYAVTGPDPIEEIFRRLAASSRLWCRVRVGSGSVGAIPVRTPEQARAWISYWEEMRGVSASFFTLSEYLPGRSFACQSLWKDGQPILVKTYERLSYFGSEGNPSATSSVAALAKIVSEPRLVETSAQAVRALDGRASGAFDVDLRDDRHGIAQVTEINAGRLISGTNLFDLTGRHNMASTYVRLALGQPVAIDEPYDVVEDYYMVRDFDTLPDIFHADDFFEGIDEARRAGDAPRSASIVTKGGE